MVNQGYYGGVKSPGSKLFSDKFYKIVGAKIKDRRDAKGITQESLAQSIELTRTSVNNIEHGRQKILLDTFWQISSILDISLMELLPLPEEVNTSVKKNFPSDTPEDVKNWIFKELVPEES